MGRPSKLTEAQWAEITARMIKGEQPASLAREFGVSRALLSQRISKRVEKVRSVAEEVAKAQISLQALPVSEQFLAVNLAEGLKDISGHLVGAARFSAATSHRLAGIAHAKVQEIDDASPLEQSQEALKSMAVLQRMANDASNIPLNLLAANKETVQKFNQAVNEDEAEDDLRITVRRK